jgi:hypothetical protein
MSIGTDVKTLISISEIERKIAESGNDKEAALELINRA